MQLEMRLAIADAVPTVFMGYVYTREEFRLDLLHAYCAAINHWIDTNMAVGTRIAKETYAMFYDYADFSGVVAGADARLSAVCFTFKRLKGCAL